MTQRRTYTALLSLILLSAACGGPEPINELSLGLVVDDKAVGFVQAFQVVALETTARDGSALSCDGYRPSIPVDDPRAPICGGSGLTCQAQIPWQLGQKAEAQLALRVPSGKPLIFVAKGLAPSARGAHVVVRGCKQMEAFVAGAGVQVIIDALATAGAACQQNPASCETGYQCQADATLPGGYCTAQCGSDLDCLPGSVCAMGPAGGICARPCDDIQDCKGSGSGTQVYSCEGRKSPQGACQNICIWPEWNKASQCGI